MGIFAALLPFLKGTVGKAIVSNVATSAISSLANRSQARADRRQALGDQAEQFVRLRDAAEKAGFNPLTALRANPTGGMVNPTPALASGAFLRDALGAGVQTYFNRDKIVNDEERDRLERGLMRQELANMQLQGKAFEKSMKFGFEVPTANNYTGTDKGKPYKDPGVYPLYISVYDQKTGRTSEMLNPEVVEIGPGEAATGLIGLGVSDFFGNSGFFSSTARAKPAKAPNRAEIWRKQ
jgi:hypothetical protein